MSENERFYRPKYLWTARILSKSIWGPDSRSAREMELTLWWRRGFSSTSALKSNMQQTKVSHPLKTGSSNPYQRSIGTRSRKHVRQMQIVQDQTLVKFAQSSTGLPRKAAITGWPVRAAPTGKSQCVQESNSLLRTTTTRIPSFPTTLRKNARQESLQQQFS